MYQIYNHHFSTVIIPTLILLFYPCTIILSVTIYLNALPSSVGVEPHTAGSDALSDATAPEYMFPNK